MALEIEKKFLLKNDSWRKDVTSSCRITQGYIAASGVTVRVRISDNGAFLTLKGRPDANFSRTEFEYPVPESDAKAMLAEFCGTRIVDKIRHFVPAGNGLIWEIDEYLALNTGLFTAEIELPSPDTAFDIPDWLGDDVTGDPTYTNGALSRNPYTMREPK